MLILCRAGEPVEADVRLQITRSYKGLGPGWAWAPQLSPSSALLRDYLKWRQQGEWPMRWPEYRERFLREMEEPEARRYLAKVRQMQVEGKSVALACFCRDERYCHRRLVAELLRGGWPGGGRLGCGRVTSCLGGLEIGRKGVEMVRLEDLARGREEQPARARGEWVAEEVGAIRKNNREAVVVRLVSRDGRRFVDVREFYWARDAGEYRPSKQGVALDVTVLPELLALLEEAGRKAAG